MDFIIPTILGAYVIGMSVLVIRNNLRFYK